MNTIVTNMAYSQFYASVYAGLQQINLDSEKTTTVFREKIEFGLPKFYAAVLVFSVKANRYFLSVGSGGPSFL